MSVLKEDENSIIMWDWNYEINYKKGTDSVRIDVEDSIYANIDKEDLYKLVEKMKKLDTGEGKV